jgi:PAS domain S-box-containing protein
MTESTATATRSRPDKPPGRWLLSQEAGLRREVENRLLATSHFHQVSADLLRTVLADAALVRVPAGYVLFEEGSPDTDLMYILIEGELEVIVGGRLIVAVSDPGESVGELGFLSHQPRMARVRTARNSILVELSTQAISGFRGENPERYIRFLELLGLYLGAKLTRTTRMARSYGEKLLETEQLRTSHAELERRVQEKLQEVLLYTHVFRSSQDAVVIADPAGPLLTVNPAAAALLGWKDNPVGQVSLYDRFPQARDLRQSLQDPEGTGFKAEWDLADTIHGNMPVEATLTPVVQDGRVLALALFLRDIRGQRMLLESLEKSQLELIEYSKDLERKVAERTRDLRLSNEELQSTNAELRRETDSKDAALRKLKEAQSHLLESEKMIGLGQLAAGVAHEINNPIGFVHSNLNTLGEYLAQIRELLAVYSEAEAAASRGGNGLAPVFERARQIKEKMDYNFVVEDSAQVVTDAVEGVQRVAAIVRNLKEFTHIDQGESQWFNVNDGLDSTVKLIWNELKYKAEVRREYGEVPDIECHAAQLSQLFLNVLMNAAQAIDKKGTITLRTVANGDQVVIQIQDDGCGIPPDVLPHIFEPFFTTRPVGQGMGLGLTSAYSIVRNHRGTIHVESKPGAGTTFTIRLPVSQPKQSAKATPP